MNKKTVVVFAFILMVSFGIISLYTTFAYNEETMGLEESTANNNITFTLNNLRKQEVVIGKNEEKLVDIVIKNTYDSVTRYGLCYKLISPENIPANLIITKAEESANPLESTINPGETKIITIKITNNSEYNVDLLVGALVGFENGNINDLLSGEEILIK